MSLDLKYSEIYSSRQIAIINSIKMRSTLSYRIVTSKKYALPI